MPSKRFSESINFKMKRANHVSFCFTTHKYSLLQPFRASDIKSSPKLISHLICALSYIEGWVDVSFVEMAPQLKAGVVYPSLLFCRFAIAPYKSSLVLESRERPRDSFCLATRGRELKQAMMSLQGKNSSKFCVFEPCNRLKIAYSNQNKKHCIW